MKNNPILLAGILILGGVFGFFLGNSNSNNAQPREGEVSSLPLTVMRSDCIFDGQAMTAGADKTILNFKITNRTATTTYEITNFGFYPGILNEYPADKITGLRVYDGANLIWSLSASSSPWLASTTPIAIAPNNSKFFSLKADLAQATSSLLRIALGEMDAIHDNGFQTIVFKEVEKRPLNPPFNPGPIDDSLESAFFIVE